MTFRAITAVLLLLIAGCGGSPEGRTTVTSAFTAEHALLFDDGVDFVHDPSVLEGRWRSDWSEELEERVKQADWIGRVAINTVRIDVDLDRKETYRLYAEIEQLLTGEQPPEEVMLPVREGEPGYGTVHGNDERIRQQPFVAFVKWYTDDRGRVMPHWHLSPATDAISRRVQFLVDRHRVPSEGAGRRVIYQTDED